MTNWTSLFYWLTVVDSAKSFICTIGVISLIISAILIIARIGCAPNFDDSPKTYEASKKWYPKFLAIGLTCVTICIFTPSMKETLFIIAGGATMNYLQSDSTAREIPKEALNLVRDELRALAQEAKVDIGLNQQKERILDSAKKMTTEELLNRVQVDTNFVNLIRGK